MKPVENKQFTTLVRELDEYLIETAPDGHGPSGDIIELLTSEGFFFLDPKSMVVDNTNPFAEWILLNAEKEIYFADLSDWGYFYASGPLSTICDTVRRVYEKEKEKNEKREKRVRTPSVFDKNILALAEKLTSLSPYVPNAHFMGVGQDPFTVSYLCAFCNTTRQEGHRPDCVFGMLENAVIKKQETK